VEPRETLNRQVLELRNDEDSIAWQGNTAELSFLPMLENIKAGRVVFLLGAAASLGRLPLAKAFYQELRRAVEAAPLDLDDASVAQAFVDRNGRAALAAKVDAMLNVGRANPTAVHWFIATLRSRLREKGFTPGAPVILTTNFDDWMEEALRRAGERFHLFVFRVEPPHQGRFIYRTPDGATLVVDRPASFRHDLEDVPIVVKYHGGLHGDVPLPVSYAFTRFDFVHAVRHLPDAVPATIMRRIADSSLLFLGHGLRDESVEALVRGLPACRKIPSWAVQLDVSAGFKSYWNGLDVQVLDVPLERFIPELHERIEALGAPHQSR
jgi:hypothetical protein